MNNLTISNKTALKLYPTASVEFKTLLEETFSKEFFSQDITERVKLFEDALEVNGRRVEDVLPYINPMNEFQEALNAVAMVWEFIEAINEGWIADFSNSSQPKYYIWWTWSGSGLSYYDCGITLASTDVGSRLCCESAKKAKHVAECMQTIANKFLTQKIKS